MGIARRRWPILQLGRDYDAERFVPPGWCKDFAYYSANNHPFHGIFCADQTHPLLRRHRIVIELTTIALTVVFEIVWSAFLKEKTEGTGFTVQFIIRQLWSLLLLTIPSFIFWWFLYFLFVMPFCGTVDRTRANQSELQRASFFICCGRVGAYII